MKFTGETASGATYGFIFEDWVFFFAIYGENLNRYQIQDLLRDFYRRQAYRLFPERLKNCMMLTPWVKNLPKLKLGFMRSRYGSCSNRGDISLNIHLIKARFKLIDYVILHELCHIKAHHHGPEFYALMSDFQPNWQELKAKLKQFNSLN